MSWFKDNKGQALVEFALVLPLFLLLVLGIIEFARIFHTHLVVTSAAREAVRKAAVTGNETDIKNAILNSINSIATSAEEKHYTHIMNESKSPESSSKIWYYVHYPENSGVRKEGDPVEVYIKGRVDIITPLISNIVGSPWPVPAKGTRAVMRIERL